MSANLVFPANFGNIEADRTDLIEFLQPSLLEPLMSEGGNVAGCPPRVDEGRHAVAGLCSEMSDEEIFNQFQRLSRVMRQAMSLAGGRPDLHEGREWSPSSWSRSKTDSKARDESSLLGNNENATYSASDVREPEDETPKKFDRERNLQNTSIADGIEEWVKRLDPPETPDNRVKAMYASICVERKKRELYDRIHGSILETDPVLRGTVVKVQANDTLKKLQLVKYSVETIEDVLMLLSRTSVEPHERASLIEKLAATLHREAVNELLRFAYARNLVIIAMDVLLDSDLRKYAVQVLKTWLFDIVDEQLLQRPRQILLNKIIERGNQTESECLERSFLAPFANCSERAVGLGIEGESQWSNRARSIIGEFFAKPGGSAYAQKSCELPLSEKCFEFLNESFYVNSGAVPFASDRGVESTLTEL